MAVNGQLTSSMLAPLGFKDYYGRTAYLSLDAAASLFRLADRLGLTLGSADVSEAYRDIARQEALFTDRFTTIPIDGYQYTVRWDGKTWYLRPGVASAAVPGTSDHGWGNAVDARASLKVRMRANLALCREYGWTFPIKSEDWHALYTRSLDQHYGEDDVLTDADKQWFVDQFVASLDFRVERQPFRDEGDRSVGFHVGKHTQILDQIRAMVVSLTKQVAGIDAQMDEAALAAELAPLLKDMVLDLDDKNLDAIAQAVVDEQARRLSNAG